MSHKYRVEKPPGETIQAVAERADFGPAYEGENFVTLTFRVPRNTPAYVGKFDLIPRGPGTFWWALSNADKAAGLTEKDTP